MDVPLLDYYLKIAGMPVHSQDEICACSKIEFKELKSNLLFDIHVFNTGR